MMKNKIPISRDRLRYHWSKFLRMTMASKAKYLAEKVRNFSRTLVVRRRISQSYEMSRSMHQHYQLKAYAGRVVVYLADDSFFSIIPNRDPRHYYERLASGGVTYKAITGDHDTILRGAGALAIAQSLSKQIAKS